MLLPLKINSALLNAQTTMAESAILVPITNPRSFVRSFIKSKNFRQVNNSLLSRSFSLSLLSLSLSLSLSETVPMALMFILLVLRSTQITFSFLNQTNSLSLSHSLTRVSLAKLMIILCFFCQSACSLLPRGTSVCVFFTNF